MTYRKRLERGFLGSAILVILGVSAVTFSSPASAANPSPQCMQALYDNFGQVELATNSTPDGVANRADLNATQYLSDSCANDLLSIFDQLDSYVTGRLDGLIDRNDIAKALQGGWGG